MHRVYSERYFVLHEGKLAYYVDEAKYLSGNGPIKGRQIEVAGYRVEVAPTEVSALRAPSARALRGARA